MDDITWIGRSKADIEKQLEIADSFNRFNGIKVNPNKFKLIVINNSEKEENRCVKYGKNSIMIKSETDDSSVRFLGVWVSSKNNRNFVKNQILNDVNNIFNLTKGKIITADQMVYIINMVAISRIEYKANLTLFNENDAKMMTAKVRKLMRYKLRVTNTGLNVLLSNQDIIKMIDFFDRQTETHISNLVLKLNDRGMLGVMIKLD